MDDSATFKPVPARLPGAATATSVLPSTISLKWASTIAEIRTDPWPHLAGRPMHGKGRRLEGRAGSLADSPGQPDRRDAAAPLVTELKSLRGWTPIPIPGVRGRKSAPLSALQPSRCVRRTPTVHCAIPVAEQRKWLAFAEVLTPDETPGSSEPNRLRHSRETPPEPVALRQGAWQFGSQARVHLAHIG